MFFRISQFLCFMVMLGGMHLVFAETADSVYTNGRIFTVNDKQPWAEAVAIKGKHFLFVGNNAAVRQYMGKNTEVVDLKGQMVMPGIHDGHEHLILAGARAAFWCPMPKGPFGEASAQEISACAKNIKREWLEVGLYFAEQFPDGKPDRKYLDKLFPDRPVVFTESTFHIALVNTKAMELAGITAETPEPEGGEIRRDKNGRLTGELVEEATGLIAKFRAKYSPEEDRVALLKAAGIANSYGIVSVQEAGATESALKAMKLIDDAGELTLHITTHIPWDAEFFDMPEEVSEALIAKRSQFQSEHVNTDAIKFIVDGTPTPPYFTQADLDEKSGEPELGMIQVPPDILNKQVVRFDRMGMKVKMHVAGAGAAHVALDAIAEARRANPSSGIIHDLAHTNLVVESDMDRMRELNAAGEMSPTVWHLYGKHLGDPPRRAWRFRTLSNKGVLLTIGSDWPVSSSPTMFPALQGLLEYEDESLDLVSGIRALTINGAISVGQQNIAGSIEVGKLANMIVLDRNLFKVPVREIGETHVLKTIFEGREVYSGKD